MKKTTMIIVMALLCLNFCAHAQEIKPLKIGDKLPAAFWQQEHEFYQGRANVAKNLQNYSGKFILLDFWATWCGTCVSKMPLIDSLQKEHSELKVILVNSTTVKEKPGAVSAFFRDNKIGAKYQLPTIVSDTLLTKLFPFKLLPHLVWVDWKGTVIAVSSYQFLERKIIGLLLEQHQRSLKMAKR